VAEGAYACTREYVCCIPGLTYKVTNDPLWIEQTSESGNWRLSVSDGDFGEGTLDCIWPCDDVKIAQPKWKTAFSYFAWHSCDPPYPPPCDPANHYTIWCFDCSYGSDIDYDCEDDCNECESPIIIDVDGNGFDLTAAADGVQFDLMGDGRSETWSWTNSGSDDVWLALDRNGNGVVDNGQELFGNHTPQPPVTRPNGYLALAEYDRGENGGNSDGIIDRNDAVYAFLRAWRDVNHDGISDTRELLLLDSLGIVALDLSYKESRRIDKHGNQFAYRAKVWVRVRGAHVVRWSSDVFLSRVPD